MRTGLLVAAVLVISLANTGTGQGLTEVFDAFGDFVDNPDRQSDVNDNIPAVFGATLAASLFANLIFQASQNCKTQNKI